MGKNCYFRTLVPSTMLGKSERETFCIEEKGKNLGYVTDKIIKDSTFHNVEIGSFISARSPMWVIF